MNPAAPARAASFEGPLRISRLQAVAGALALASAGVLALAVPEFVERVQAHRERASEPRWEGRRIFDDAPEFLGRPVKIETVEPSGPAAAARVLITWDGQSHALETHNLDDPRLPGLYRHENWFALVQLTAQPPTEGSPAPAEGSATRPLTRLVAVARGPAAGLNPDTWGAASYRDWVYTFVELTPDRGIEVTESRFRDLDATTWRHFLATLVTPGLYRDASRAMSAMSYPNFSGVRGTLAALGWTFPAISFASMGFVVGSVVLAGSFASRQRVERLVARHERRIAYAPPQ